MFLVYLLLAFLIFKYMTHVEPYTEKFRNLRVYPMLGRRYRKTVNMKPRQQLPPGTTDINHKFKNKRVESNQSDYCEDNPTCYPCPGWKHMGAPMCLS